MGVVVAFGRWYNRFDEPKFGNNSMGIDGKRDAFSSARCGNERDKLFTSSDFNGQYQASFIELFRQYQRNS